MFIFKEAGYLITHYFRLLTKTYIHGTRIDGLRLRRNGTQPTTANADAFAGTPLRPFLAVLYQFLVIMIGDIGGLCRCLAVALHPETRN